MTLSKLLRQQSHFGRLQGTIENHDLITPTNELPLEAAKAVTCGAENKCRLAREAAANTPNIGRDNLGLSNQINAVEKPDEHAIRPDKFTNSGDELPTGAVGVHPGRGRNNRTGCILPLQLNSDITQAADREGQAKHTVLGSA
ncbi:MAG: hypothetical protein ACPGVG_00355 [Mycobacterium sp.]